MQTMHRGYHLPSSLPPSTFHTVDSSLRTDPSDARGSLQRPAFRRSASQAVQWALARHHDPPSSSDTPHPRPALTRSHRALTLPSSQRDVTTDCSLQQPPTLTRRFSSSSGSSASVSDSPTIASQSLPSAGIGRKVAESLQLFKESTVTDAWDIPNPDKPTGSRRHSTSHHPDSVSETKYEFVKRADWPDPETAAIRRERSSTALDRVRTLDTITQQHNAREVDIENGQSNRDATFGDPPQWRRDTASYQEPYTRGRRRERVSDVSVFGHEESSPSSPCIRPHSRGYPPSTSQSSCPTNHVPALYNLVLVRDAAPSQQHAPDTHAPIDHESLHSHVPSHYTPPAISPLPPLISSAHRPYSPWSTDDESAWETSSVTSDASTTSGTSEQPVSLVTFPSLSLDQERQSKGEDFLDDPGAWNEDHLNMTFSDSQESLPHIPLRPFRNQVGGHSALYKFTKRALCKVKFDLLSSTRQQLTCTLSSASGFTRKPVL